MKMVYINHNFRKDFSKWQKKEKKLKFPSAQRLFILLYLISWSYLRETDPSIYQLAFRIKDTKIGVKGLLALGDKKEDSPVSSLQMQVYTKTKKSVKFTCQILYNLVLYSLTHMNMVTYLLNSSHDHMLNRFFQCHYIFNMFYDLKKLNLKKYSLLYLNYSISRI
jgi:hypothetical protein